MEVCRGMYGSSVGRTWLLNGVVGRRKRVPDGWAVGAIHPHQVLVVLSHLHYQTSSVPALGLVTMLVLY